MKGIAFGQYYPAKSIMHRLDPRMKIIIGILYIVACFLCKNVISFAVLAFSAAFIILISRIPVRVVLKSIKAIIFIMIFTAVLNIFWTKGEADELLFSWQFINVYVSGLYNAHIIVRCDKAFFFSHFNQLGIFARSEAVKTC